MIHGNLTGVAPHARKLLERIYRRRVPLDTIATPELIRSLAEATVAVQRQVGALVHRSGAVESVIVGTSTGLMLPDIGRLRAAQGRFRALRLVHTHLFGEPLTRDDLVDLTRLRLDLVCAVLITPEGEPQALTWAYNMPTSEADEHGPAEGGSPNGSGNGQATAKSYEIVGPRPYGQAQPHFGQLITSLEEEFARRGRARAVHRERAMLIHVGDKRAGAMNRAKSSLAELASLAETAGVSVVDRVIQLRDHIDPKLVLGRGKLEEVVMRAIDRDVDVLIFDRELSPSQSHGIAASTDLRVLDRSQLILDIFAQHAATRDGKLQVELAQLKYRLPFLSEKDDALSRLTGGIGGRGPGETKLEIGRRRARERVTRLERELKDVAKKRDQLRRRRVNGPEPIVALVGYTNAGKSTLLNALTGAGVLAEDKLFATLDPRARRLRLPNGRHVILTDTVGFIRDMPQDLFTAFKATFDEARDADLLIHVLDVSNAESAEQEQTTDQLLDRLELDQKPRLMVLNKADLLPDGAPANTRGSNSIFISAATGLGIGDLLTRIGEVVAPKLGSSSARPPAELDSDALQG
ncbi:MAG TPA: GTPase HflX [Polyangiaceae bacterium]|nr:GTPase HflX [Polyangiaceae bacterium]